MTIEEFVLEKRGTYDKFFTMYEVCNNLSIEELNDDPLEAIRDMCKLFIEHPLHKENVINISISYTPYIGSEECENLDLEEIRSFIYKLNEFVDPYSGTTEDPEIRRLNVNFIINKFEENSEESIIAQELEKCRNICYFYNNYIRKEGEFEYTEESMKEMVKRRLIKSRK